MGAPQREVAVLATCRSPFVTRYYGAYLHGSQVWLVLELMTGGSAGDLLRAHGAGARWWATKAG